jgi:hydroxypyruvate isomerase
MPRFAANLTMMFTELPFLSRFAAAAEAGFDAIEFLFPYEFDRTELASLLTANGLTLVLHNLPVGDRKSTRLNSSHMPVSRMPSSA